MAISEDVTRALAAKFAVMRPHLEERQWRLYLGSEARALGYGGIAAVARASGAAESAVAAGVAEAEDEDGPGALAPGRARRPGGGRKKLEDKDPRLRAVLRELAEASTRGDPVAEVTWCSQSLRELAGELARRGWRCGKDVIARMLREDGYSLQGMAKVAEGKQHPDRDGQFGHVNAVIAAFIAAGDPVVSADGKKKEQLGPFYRAGRSWRPAGDPVRVRDHDFPDKELGAIVPYGVYDIAANRGFVSAGTSGNTGAFAVSALRAWWQREGSLRYPGAGRLLIVCDAGGSNGVACRLWKDQLAVLAAETGLEITVCHFPPGTSKWNKIEHRLFCHITRTWRARPLMSIEDAVAGIAATTTSQGLKCTAVTDDGEYPTGLEVSGQRMRYLEERVLDRHPFHGEWNYTVLPEPRPAPEPEPEPGPGPDPAVLTALAALAGITGLPALLTRITVPAQAAREQRLHLHRGAARRVTSGPAAPVRLPLPAAVAATACHHQAGISYQLPGRLPGVDPSTVSTAASHLTPVLAQHGITPRHQRAPVRTPAQLREHATAAGITLPDPPPPIPPRTRCNHHKTTTHPS
jgi:hypothetical protein